MIEKEREREERERQVFDRGRGSQDLFTALINRGGCGHVYDGVNVGLPSMIH